MLLNLANEADNALRHEPLKSACMIEVDLQYELQWNVKDLRRVTIPHLKSNGMAIVTQHVMLGGFSTYGNKMASMIEHRWASAQHKLERDETSLQP